MNDWIFLLNQTSDLLFSISSGLPTFHQNPILRTVMICFDWAERMDWQSLWP
jgi:hypothetical protein